MTCIFSILFSRLWIIFTVITLNSFSGSWPISSLFIWCCGFLPWSFICTIFLCFFVFSNLLCLTYPLVFGLAISGCGWSSGLCRLYVGRDLCLPSGGRRWVFPPSIEQVCVSGMFGGVCGKPVSSWHLACCLGKVPFAGAASSWVVLGLGYRKRPSWELSLINTPWDQEFSGHLVSWTQCFQPRGSGPISHQGTRIPQAVCYGSKED